MRTPNPFPLKLADLTIRRSRSDAEARSILRSLHQDHGAVFCVVGIESPHEEAREKLFLMCAQHIEHAAQTMRNDQNPARAFEHMLTRLNDDFARLGPELEVKKEKCHAIFAVCAKNQLFLSGFGNLLALFLHKTADRRFSIYELHTQLGEETGSWEKSCSVVLDGELCEGDVFYSATHIPANLLSTATLQDILVTLPAKGALERLEGFIPPAMPFAGVAIQVSSKERVSNLRVNPLGSLDMLQKTQERTAEMLGERPAQKKENVPLAQPAWMGRTDPQAIFARASELTGKGAKNMGKALKKVTSFLWGRLKHLAQKKKIKRNAATQASTSPVAAILIGVTLLLAGTGGWYLYRNTKTQNEQREAFSAHMQKVEEYIAQAEGSLIYNNTAGATQAMQEAQTLLTQTAAQTDEQKTSLAAITEKVAILLEKAQGITRVSPTILGTLPNEKEGATGVVNTGIYLFTAERETFRFNGLTASWELQPTNIGIVSTPKYAAKESDTTALVIDSAKRLARYSSATQTLNPLISGVGGLKSTEDLFVYNNTLYVLIATDQQIVKMRPQGDGYESGTPWIIARSNDITDARALAIDGSIYVLTKNTVRVFFSGKEQSWTLGTLITPLNNPVDIFTTPDSDALSILDPENKRVIVANKASGAIIAQYVNDAFSNGIALYEDEATNTLFVLTKTSLLQFTPPHLVR